MDTAFEKLDSIPNIPIEDVIDNMERYARDYTKHHTTMESDACIELVLTDSINYVGRDIEYRMHNSELNPLMREKYAQKKIKIVKPNTLLNILLNNYQAYFNEGIISSIESHSDFYDISDDCLDEDDSLNILVDYLNYISSTNGIDHEFSTKDITGIEHKKRCLTISPRLKSNY